jgi:hypothetical protein
VGLTSGGPLGTKLEIARELVADYVGTCLMDEFEACIATLQRLDYHQGVTKTLALLARRHRVNAPGVGQRSELLRKRPPPHLRSISEIL